MDCVFCGIANGRLEADLVWTSDAHLAFLDHRPLFPGHVLVIPRRHAPTLTDLDDEEVGPLMILVKRISAAVEEVMGAQGTFVAMNNRVSQSVPHLHVHVVPRTKGDGLKGFFWPRRPYRSDEDRKGVAQALRQALSE